jgi:hypothetical protein
MSAGEGAALVLELDGFEGPIDMLLALARAKAALASRKAPQPFDRTAARAELDALIARANTASA